MKHLLSLFLCLCILFLSILMPIATGYAAGNDTGSTLMVEKNQNAAQTGTEKPITSDVVIYSGNLLLSAGVKKDFPFHCDDGAFFIKVTYVHVKGKEAAVKLLLSVNGGEGSQSNLYRVYKDKTAVSQDKLGNDIRPSQEEVYEARTVWVYNEGNNNMPHSFHARDGENKISAVIDGAEVNILNITAVPAFQYPDYSEYLKTTGGLKDGAEKVQIYEAEKAYRKSDPTIYPVFDRSSVNTSPSDPVKLKLNTIGGSKWQQNGQWIEWKINVKESGFYKIGLRARQSVNSGQYATRRLVINGSVPFEQYNNLKFNYSSKFSMYELGGKDCAVYLHKGENTLKLEITLGDMADIIGRVKKVLLSLNEGYRKILSLTGTSPDTNRDYAFRIEIPATLDSLNSASRELSDILMKLTADVGGEGAYTSCFRTLISVLNKMVKDPDRIPGLFQDFEDNIAALGTWVTGAYEQPLEVDYIALVPRKNAFPKVKSNILEDISFSIKKFIGSFYMDYTVINSGEKSSLKVYIATGRDQAQSLNQLITNYFTPQYKKQVKLDLVAAAALLPATLSGNGPDVALSVTSDSPINYAIRGALTDLSPLDDYNEVVKRFSSSAMEPFVFQGKCYALPETQTFPMLFYRTDILGDYMKELGIGTINTWQDIYNIMPSLQKQYMSIAIPTDQTGLGMFLYQNNGSFYDHNLSKCTLDTLEGYAAVRQWTDFFTSYSMPISYNFADRFRSGEMPLGIADYSLYNTLQVFAPEINGLWKMVPVPATVSKDGSFNRMVPSSGLACMMMSASNKKKDAWDFMKWWTSSKTQVQYGKELESIMGSAARYSTANLEAVGQLPWSTGDYNAIMDQWKSVRGIPQLPGNYMLTRNVTFIFRSVVVSGKNAREAVIQYTEDTNNEITRKYKELGLSLS